MSSPSLNAAARGRWLAGALALIAFVASARAIAQERAEDGDVVSFLGGNRVVGKVRGLERGKLSFNTDSTGTITIEWLDVRSIVSSQRFEVSTAAGDRYFGSLVEPEQPGTVVIDTGAERRDFSLAEVVGLAEIEQTLLDGLNLDLSVGYQYAKASDITHLILGTDVRSRREQRIMEANIDATSSSSSDTEASRRINMDSQLTFLRPERWFWSGLLTLETNDELGLRLRSSIGGGRGRILRQSNNRRFMLLGGVVLTEEQLQVSGAQLAPADADDSKIEGVVGADFEWFRFDDPELDVSTRISLFPNLSDTGRFRTNLDIDLRWEILQDLFLGISIYHTHNSDPPNDGTQNDYGISTNVGWAF